MYLLTYLLLDLFLSVLHWSVWLCAVCLWHHHTNRCPLSSH